MFTCHKCGVQLNIALKSRVNVDIVCDKCGYVDYYSDSLIKKDSHDNWISIKDRLPEPNIHVLVYVKEFDFYFIAFLNLDKNKWSEGANGKDFEVFKVTHWQPLPERPKAVL